MPYVVLILCRKLQAEMQRTKNTTQRGRLPLLMTPVREAAEDAVQIDAATRRNLADPATITGVTPCRAA